MEQPRDLATRATLLNRLYRSGSADQDAWREFVDQYGRQVFKWCRHWQLQDADAEEVTQRVLLLLLGKMKEFVYDPSQSFRAWLKTVTHHAWRNLVDSRQFTQSASGDTAHWEQLHRIEARDDLTQRLEREYDRELLEQASVSVRLRVAPHNWEAFRLTAVEGEAPADVARRLEMKIANVYAARSNVQRLLREEVERLEQGDP
jgi:RNA polymerase sigma-70 factor (ECF subfamily)